MKYLGLMLALVIMATLCMSGLALADDSNWVKTDFGLVYIDKDSAGYQSLGDNAKIAADIVGYGNPYQLNNDGKNIDTPHWVAYSGQVTAYTNWFAFRAAEAYNNQKNLPIGFSTIGCWYDIPVGH